MKTLGIIGGIGPESTIDYYQSIVARYRALKPDGSYPPLIINSIDLNKLVRLFEANALNEVAEVLLREIGRLARAGADFGLLAANTPHIVFDELERRSPIPLISIVVATCDAAKARGLTRLALFGTRFTMGGRFYPDVFARNGMTLIVPDATDQEFIHDKYMNELIGGMFLPETRAGLLSIIDRLRQSAGVEAVILGGTELPLILREPSHEGIPLLDTTRIHVDAAVAQMLS